MRVVLLFLLMSLNVSASEMDVVRNLKNEITSEGAKSVEDITDILERYFADGCLVSINGKEITLKKNRFKQYATTIAFSYPQGKKDYELKIEKVVSSEDSVDVEAVLIVSSGKQMNVEFGLKDNNIIRVVCDNATLSKKQRLILGGVLNLLSD